MRRYLVIPVEVIDSINFEEVLETSAETLRMSVDGTKTFVKYDITLDENGSHGRPSIYLKEYAEYKKDEFLAVLATEEWTARTEEV